MTAKPTPIGRTFGGRYRVTERLGEGGMATVYRGVSTDDGTPVAIKLMSEDLTKSEPFVKRFLREAKTAASLRHRSTVRIFDFGIDAQTPFIVMELVEGTELLQVMAHEGRLSEARAGRIVAQICSALAVAHDLGVVHRDLKPENVMVLRDPSDPTVERVKILDFGIAKILTPELISEDSLPVSSEARLFSSDAPDLTTMGTLVGTPEYMAPEQLRGDAVDARADLYACGLILFEMLTGKVPLVGSTWVETATLRNTNVPPKLTEIIPAADVNLQALLASALELDRMKRPTSARQMQERLLALMPELANVLLPVAIPRAPARGGTVRLAPVVNNNTLPSPSSGSEARTEPLSPRGGPATEAAPSSPQASSARVKFHNRSDWDVQGETLPVMVDGPAPAAQRPVRVAEAERTLSSSKEDHAPERPPSLSPAQIALRVVLLVAVLVGVAAITAFLVRR